MPRRLAVLNVVLAAMSAVLIAYIVRQVATPTPLRKAPVLSTVMLITSALAETSAPRSDAKARAKVFDKRGMKEFIFDALFKRYVCQHAAT